MNNNFKKMYENIPISDKLDYTIKNTIKKAKIEKKKHFLKNSSIKITGAIASIVMIFTCAINYNVAFANTVKNIPIISSISEVLQFHYDKNVSEAVKQNLAQNINVVATNNNIGINVTNVVGDNKDKFILYTLKSSDKKFKNLLLDKFTIMDTSNNIIIDSSKFRDGVVPPTLINQDSDFLVLIADKPFKCIVSSIGDSINNYSQKGETYGSIELIALANSTIPDNISLSVSGFSEAYNTSYSQKNYNKFINNYNRTPMETTGNWSLNINTTTAKTEKTEEYDNIKFSANNTDFQINYFKIYPTYIETNIQLGKDKTSTAQCWSIGTKDTAKKDTYKRLPYLIDENGNKYMVSENSFICDNKKKSVTISFQSSYYKNPKKLYLVISQLNYLPGDPYTNITPIKIKIK